MLGGVGGVFKRAVRSLFSLGIEKACCAAVWRLLSVAVS